MVGWLVGWLVGWWVGWWVGGLVGCLVGWVDGVWGLVFGVRGLGFSAAVVWLVVAWFAICFCIGFSGLQFLVVSVSVLVCNLVM